MVVRPFVYVEPPTPEPYRHGLLDAALEVSPATIADGDRHWQYGGVEWQSLASYRSATYPGGLADVGGAGGPKVLPACLSPAQAIPFVVYGGVQAGALGHNENDNQWWTDRARRIVDLSGQFSAEQALWTGVAGAAPALNDAATPLAITGQADTTAAAVDLITGVAVLEGYLAQNYAGRGIIHAPRGAAPHLAAVRQVTRDPDNQHVLTTTLGTRWAFGAGYDGTGPGAAAPPASASGLGYFWMYVTGQVLVIRDEITTPAEFKQAIDKAHNQVALLAEQPWLVGIDVVKAGVLVKTQTAA